MPGTADLYAQYEASLAALQGVPDQVTRGLDAARRAEETAQKAADAAFQRDTRRLSSLRHTVQARYDAAVSALKKHDTRLPPQVRPETGVPGDEAALKQSLYRQASAATAVDAALKGAETNAGRAQSDAARRAQDAQQAAAALQARQERVRRDREAAAAQAAAHAADRAAARRRHVIFGLIGGTAVLIIAVIVTLVIINQ